MDRYLQRGSCVRSTTAEGEQGGKWNDQGTKSYFFLGIFHPLPNNLPVLKIIIC